MMDKPEHTLTIDDGIPDPGEKYPTTMMDSVAYLLFAAITLFVMWYCFRNMMSNVLSKIVFVGFIGIFINILIPKGNHTFIRINTLVYAIIPMILAFGMLSSYDSTQGDMQFIEHETWINITDSLAKTASEQTSLMKMDYRVGVDGLSFPLILLTTLLCVIGVIASWGIKNRTKEYFCWFLILQIGMLGTFVALNYILFYVFWEMMLVPMYFLIAIWGGPRREYAAIKFFLYTLFGSIFLLLGIIYMYFSVALASGNGDAGATWDIIRMQDLAPDLLTLKSQKIIWMAFFLGFAIKVPIFPFHTWLPDAHVEAPTAVSVILAGILLKMGTYGFLRFIFPTLPEASHYFIPFLGILGTINIVYGAMVALAQSDLKKLVAYSSVGHMGFVILGFASMNEMGYTGAQFQIISHGIISAALFLIVGVLYDRAHTREINIFGGIAQNMPKYALITGIATMANLGLPGLCGFWGELWTLYGAFQSSWVLESGLDMMKVLVCISAFGILITAGYMLWMYQRVFLGPLEKWASLKEMDYREAITLVPLVLLMIALGVFPKPLITLFEASIGDLVVRLQAFAPLASGG